MKSEEIVFIAYPNRILVCEGCLQNPKTPEGYVYAHIVKTGDVKWGKYAKYLRHEQKEEIIRFAEYVRTDNSGVIANWRQNATTKV